MHSQLAMNSVRGTRSVRLQRRKSGLGFSIKGGSEHGIPIVVSDVETNTSAGKMCPDWSSMADFLCSWSAPSW